MRAPTLLVLCALIAAPASAAEAVDMTPVTCGWSQLSQSEQTELREAFSAGQTHTAMILQYTSPTAAQVQRVMQACHLTFNDAQAGYYALALGRKAAEELARWGIDHRGAIKSAMVDKSLAQMHPGKRVMIGDALSCTPSAKILGEWDQSVISAMRRAYVKTVDGRTVALMGIAMFSVFAQEGYMRRIAGTAPPCENSE